jgi:general secretion pathway protein F
MLAERDLTVLQLASLTTAPRVDRAMSAADRIAFLRTVAQMVEAGVDLLEALETAAGGRDRNDLQATIQALRSGQSFAAALATHVSGLPPYVAAMSRVGEATGRLGQVLREATEQMAFEDRLRREVANALTYPLFLLCAGAAAMAFIFTQVVPKFSVMLGETRGDAPWVSRLVLDAGETANAHPVLVFGVLIGGGMALLAVVANPIARRMAYGLARAAPVIGPLLWAREISMWTRLIGFSLGQGISLLEAAALARNALPPGAFRDGLGRFEQDLKAGVAIDASLGLCTPLTPADLSLLRAGQKAGSLPRMFGFVAATYEERLKDGLKRFTMLIEPLAVGVISIFVGVVALSLILALSSVYDRVQ